MAVVWLAHGYQLLLSLLRRPQIGLTQQSRPVRRSFFMAAYKNQRTRGHLATIRRSKALADGRCCRQR
eukprot:2605050-Prymnesium_polylepis.1